MSETSTDSPDLLVIKRDEAITEIRLNRPERLNALNFELVADIHTALDEVGNDAECKVVLLTGAGRAFSAGLDLKDWGAMPEVGEHPHVQSGTDVQTFISNLTVHMQRLPQVIIAAINGPAYGGGLALACAADLRIASVTAKFCSAFIRTGLSGTDIGITYLLPRLVGASQAFDLILTGRDIDATEAMSMGLLSAVVETEELDDVAMQRAKMMTGYTSTGLRTTKEVLWENLDANSLSSALALEIRNQNLMQHAPDVVEFMKNYSKNVTGR